MLVETIHTCAFISEQDIDDDDDKNDEVESNFSESNDEIFLERKDKL